MDKQFQELLKQLKQAGLDTKTFELAMQGAAGKIKESKQVLDDMGKALQGVRNEARGIGNDFEDVYSQLQAIVAEMSKAKSPTNELRKAFGGITSQASKLNAEQAGIYTLTVKDLRAMQSKVALANEEVTLNAKALMSEKGVRDLSDKGLETAQAALKGKKKMTDEELAFLKAYREEEEIGKKIQDEIEKRLELEENVEKAAGLTLGTFQVMEKTLGKLGMSGLSSEFSDLAEEIKDNVRKQIKDAGDDANIMGIKVNAFFQGLAGAGKIIGKALFDPLTITTAIVDKFFELDKLNTNFVNMTGQNVSYANAISTRFATAADIMGVMVEFTKETGLNAQAVFDEDTLARIAEAKNLLGLSNKEAAQLGTLSKVSGMTIEESKESIVAATNAFNAQNDTAVAHGVVLKDVLNTSEGIALSFGGSTAAIGEAASAARSLGMNLAQVDRIAESMLNFESSIEKELEAQLLTGNAMNLSKARQLALDNDLAGLAKELASQGASAAEFANMNRIQQNALAESLGMSRDELAKMLIAQEQQGNLSDEQRAKMRGVTVEQLQQMEASESLKKAFSKFAEPLAKMLTALTPIVNAFASIVSFVAPLGGILLPVIMAVKALGGGFQMAAMNLGKMKSNAMGFVDNIKNFKPKEFLSGLKKSFGMGQNIIKDASLPSGYRDKKTGQAVSKKIGDKFFGVSADKTKEVAGATQDMQKSAPPAKLGASIKEFFEGLAAGLKQMASTKVIKGAGAALLSSPALIALGVASPGLLLLGNVNGRGISEGLTGIAGGLKSFADGKVLLGSLALIPAALGFVAMTAGAVGIAAIALGGIPAGAGLTAMGSGLVAFGNAMATMTPLGPVGLVAPIALGLLTSALIPLGYALNLAAPALEAIGTIISSVFAGIATTITAVSNGFVLMFGAVSENIGAFLLMGPALLGIGAGLAMIAMTGLGALPVLAALTGLAVVATPLIALGASLFGGGDDGGDSDMGEKLDKILAAIENGGDVYLDGTKVGEALTLGSYKL
jgi:hypothetical protein